MTTNCSNDRDFVTLRHYTSEQPAEIHIEFLDDQGRSSTDIDPQGNPIRTYTLCSDADPLFSYIRFPQNVAYHWVPQTNNIVIEPEGYGGRPAYEEKYVKIFGDFTCYANCNLMIEGQSDYIAFKIYGSPVRMGIAFGISRLHGQEPGFSVYMIVMRELFTPQFIVSVIQYYSNLKLGGEYPGNLDDLNVSELLGLLYQLNDTNPVPIPNEAVETFERSLHEANRDDSTDGGRSWTSSIASPRSFRDQSSDNRNNSEVMITGNNGDLTITPVRLRSFNLPDPQPIINSNPLSIRSVNVASIPTSLDYLFISRNNVIIYGIMSSNEIFIRSSDLHFNFKLSVVFQNMYVSSVSNEIYFNTGDKIYSISYQDINEGYNITAFLRASLPEDILSFIVSPDGMLIFANTSRHTHVLRRGRRPVTIDYLDMIKYDAESHRLFGIKDRNLLVYKINIYSDISLVNQIDLQLEPTENVVDVHVLRTTFVVLSRDNSARYHSMRVYDINTYEEISSENKYNNDEYIDFYSVDNQLFKSYHFTGTGYVTNLDESQIYLPDELRVVSGFGNKLAINEYGVMVISSYSNLFICYKEI